MSDWVLIPAASLVTAILGYVEGRVLTAWMVRNMRKRRI